jgi:hypothetical protein
MAARPECLFNRSSVLKPTLGRRGVRGVGRVRATFASWPAIKNERTATGKQQPLRARGAPIFIVASRMGQMVEPTLRELQKRKR